MNKKLKLTESEIQDVIKESVKKVLKEVQIRSSYTTYNPTTQGSSIGKDLAYLLCDRCRTDKKEFVPIIDLFLKNCQNQQMVQSVGNGFVEGLLSWLQHNEPQFYQSRINNQQVH